MWRYGNAHDDTAIAASGLPLYDKRPWWEKAAADGGAASGFTADEAAIIAVERMQRIHENCEQCHRDRTRIARKAGRPGGRILTPTYHGATPAATSVISYLATQQQQPQQQQSHQPTNPASSHARVSDHDHLLEPDADPNDFQAGADGGCGGGGGEIRVSEEALRRQTHHVLTVKELLEQRRPTRQQQRPRR